MSKKQLVVQFNPASDPGPGEKLGDIQLFGPREVIKKAQDYLAWIDKYVLPNGKSDLEFAAQGTSLRIGVNYGTTGFTAEELWEGLKVVVNRQVNAINEQL